MHSDFEPSSQMVDVVQFSDLHVGSTSYQGRLLANVVQYVNEHAPDVAVCCGDVTNRGRLREFEKARKKLEALEVPLLCVPGNRDAKNNGLFFYEKMFGARTHCAEIMGATFLCCNTAISDLRQGYVGNFQLHWLAKRLQQCETTNRILVMHHHLVPVPDAGRETDVIMDAGDVLEMTQIFDATLVLCGDRHVPYAWVIGPTTFLCAGTASSYKVRGDEGPSFNHVRISGDGKDLEVRTVDSATLEPHPEPIIVRKGGHTLQVRHRLTRIEHLLNSKLYESVDVEGALQFKPPCAVGAGSKGDGGTGEGNSRGTGRGANEDLESGG
ncbi:MAG: hypothetical protein Kow0069_09940 [Promethearchaeota archaeon]